MLAFLRIHKLKKQFLLFLFTNFLNPKIYGYSLVWHMNTGEIQASFLYMLCLKFFFLMCVVCECVYGYVLCVGITHVWEHVSVQGHADVRNHPQQLSHLLH